eukprot:4320528-Heterocapsa_arctica.AAC.1
MIAVTDSSHRTTPNDGSMCAFVLDLQSDAGGLSESAQGLSAATLDLSMLNATARRVLDSLDVDNGMPIDLMFDCEPLSAALRTSHDVSDPSAQLYVDALRDELASKR